jgi:hypothetical protein
MILVVLSAATALALSFAIADRALKFGPAVSARFLERGNAIPPSNVEVTASNVAEWLSDPQNAVAIEGYVRVVLPMDVIFLVSFGAFLASGATALASGLMLPWWVYWIVPGLYMAADLAEDALIAKTILARDGHSTFRVIRRATRLKMLFALLSLLQLALAGGYPSRRSSSTGSTEPMRKRRPRTARQQSTPTSAGRDYYH